MTGFTKLFGSIITSTVWQEPDATRLVWITLLAEADQRGQVFASVPGLAHIARVSLPDCQKALDTFLAPDPYSRTEDHEGRRIEKIDGGWQLLNHAKYRGLLSQESVRESKRNYMRRVRAEAREGVEKVEDGGKSGQRWRQAEAEADAKKKAIGRQAGRFSEFWSVYPKKVKRKTCEEKWKAKRLDAIADQLIADVQNRLKHDQRWLDGFIPDPSTYLAQERWNDEVTKPKSQASTGKFQGRTDKQQSETPLERELGFIQHLCNLGQYDQAEADRRKADATEKYREKNSGK